MTAALADRENGPVSSETANARHVAPDVREFWRASRDARNPRRVRPHRASGWCVTSGAGCRCLSAPERHANFAVLRAADIPSVLVEMGFLSNADDEAATE